jgi:hypothetical protein
MSPVTHTCYPHACIRFTHTVLHVLPTCPHAGFHVRYDTPQLSFLPTCMQTMKEWIAAGTVDKLPHKGVSHLTAPVLASVKAMISRRVQRKEGFTIEALRDPIRAIIRSSTDARLLVSRDPVEAVQKMVSDGTFIFPLYRIRQPFP